jgi:acyl carrier protein
MSENSAVRTTVLDIIGDALNESTDDLRARPILAAHGWDSLASLEALAQFEHQFGVTLDLRAFHAVRTVDQMVDLIEDAVGAKSPPVGGGSLSGSVASWSVARPGLGGHR